MKIVPMADSRDIPYRRPMKSARKSSPSLAGSTLFAEYPTSSDEATGAKENSCTGCRMVRHRWARSASSTQ